MVKICKSTSRLADLVEWDWPINEQIKMCRILDILDLHILHIYIYILFIGQNVGNYWFVAFAYDMIKQLQ